MPHDWRRLGNGRWVAEHGRAEIGKDITTLNGYAPTNTEALHVLAGLIQEDIRKYEERKPGDPPLPQPSFTSILDDLSNLVKLGRWREHMEGLDHHDAEWGLYNARMDERRHGDQ